jgi:hypothetical protein
MCSLHEEVTAEAPTAVSNSVPKEAALFQELLAGVQPVNSAFLCGATPSGLTRVQVRTSMTDVSANSGRSFFQTALLDKSSGAWANASAGFPTELKDVLVHAPSPSGKRVATVRVAVVGDKKQQFIEVCMSSAIFQTVRACVLLCLSALARVHACTLD